MSETEALEVREARKVFYVSAAIVDDEPMFRSWQAVSGREAFAGMFQVATTDVRWSEPEPLWEVGQGEDYRLLPRHMMGEPDGPPTVFGFIAYQRGVPI
jgi:hypothetical protein